MRKPYRKSKIVTQNFISSIRKNSVYNIFLVISKITQLFSNIWSFFKEIFSSFSIRKKLSIILVLIVIFVISTLSIIFQQSEKRILKAKLQDICNLSIKYLSHNTKEWLLVKDYGAIVERVMLIKQQQIEGLDYAWVINSEGQFLAHTDISITIEDNKFIPSELKEFLSKLEDIGTRETKTHYEFYYPLSFPITENEQVQKKIVGYTGIGFLKNVILKPLYDVQKIIFIIASLVTGISVLGIYFLSKQMVKQIQALSRGAKQVGQGNLNVDISVNTRDELGDLAQEFNNMIMLLKEKIHMQKFISQMTRQMIKKNIISANENYMGQQKDVAILFSDVRSFSKFSERYQHEPQFVIELINIYLDLQALLVERHFGIVDKFVGDQIMGVFEGKRKLDNAIKAAVAIQKSIRQLNAKRDKTNKEILSVGIGINAGTAVVGNIGSKDRKDYTVVGDVVNLASHFCDNAKPGQIITSLDCYSRSINKHPNIELDPIPIKGRIQPVEICEIDYLREIIM